MGDNVQVNQNASPGPLVSTKEYLGTHYQNTREGWALSSTGEVFRPDDLAWSATYNSDDTLATESVTDGTSTFKRTYTYTSGNLTAISQWVKQ